MAEPAKIDLKTVRRGDTYVIDFYFQDTNGSTDISLITIDAQARREMDGALWFDLNPIVMDAAGGHFRIHLSNEQTREITESPPNSFSGIFDIQFSWAGSTEVYVSTIIAGNISISKDVTYGAKGSTLVPTGVVSSIQPTPSQQVQISASLDPNDPNHSDVITATEINPNQYIVTASLGLNWIVEAQEAAKQAGQYRDETKVLRDETEQLKNDTDQIKTDTGQIKTDTEQIKTDTQLILDQTTGKVQEAEQFAQAASGSASQAATSVQEAQAEVGKAASKAQEANDFRDQAEQFTTTAGQKAGEAATSAQTASQAASTSTTNVQTTEQHKQAAEAAALQTGKDKTASAASAQTATDQAGESKHWAEEARKAADETYVSGGVFTPATGAEYPDYQSVTRDTKWIVGFPTANEDYTFTTGPLSGKTARNLDVLFVDHPSMVLKLVPNPSGTAVVKVNDKEGTEIWIRSPDIPHASADDPDTNVSAELVKLDTSSKNLTQRTGSLETTQQDHSTRLGNAETAINKKLDATATAADSDKLGGNTPDHFATAQSVTTLGQTVDTKLDNTATAENSKKLGGNTPDHFATAQSVTALGQTVADKLDNTATAADSAKLGGNNPDHFATAQSVTDLSDKVTAQSTKVYRDNPDGTFTREAQTNEFIVETAGRAYTLDNTTYLKDDVVVVTTNEVGTLELTLSAGSISFPDGTTDGVLSINPKRCVKLIKVDANDWRFQFVYGV